MTENELNGTLAFDVSRAADMPPAEKQGQLARKRSESPAYREAADRLEPFEQPARVVIMHRAKLGLSQRDLGKRMGTTPSVVSRIESGQHRTSTDTIRRLAEALDGHAVLGFDFGTPGKPERGLVSL